MLTAPQLEALIAKAYNDFKEKNEDLYKNDKIEYWRQARQYKEKIVREQTYKR